MKYGVADYGMNVWAGGNYDLEDRLTGLKEIGFNGIERLEATCAAEAIEKAALFRRYGMGFATVRISNPAQNIVYSAAMGKEYVWIDAGSCSREVSMETYIRRSRLFCKTCAKYNILPALHNHLGTVVESQEELDYFMKEVPEAWLLFDIGHHAGANGDVLRTLEKYYDRIVAMHFKDIFFKDDPNARAWYEKLRFCELGGGSKAGFVPWQETAAFLKDRNYGKWVFVEHDTHLRDPFIDLKVSVDKLKEIME